VKRVEQTLRHIGPPKPPAALRGRVLEAAARAALGAEPDQDALERIWRWRHAIVAVLVLLVVAHAVVSGVAHAWGREWGWEASPSAPGALTIDASWEEP
jgi:hypothetical protein